MKPINLSLPITGTSSICSANVRNGLLYNKIKYKNKDNKHEKKYFLSMFPNKIGPPLELVTHFLFLYLICIPMSLCSDNKTVLPFSQKSWIGSKKWVTNSKVKQKIWYCSLDIYAKLKSQVMPFIIDCDSEHPGPDFQPFQRFLRNLIGHWYAKQQRLNHGRAKTLVNLIKKNLK